MLGTLRATAKRTLVLTGLVLATVGLATAADTMTVLLANMQDSVLYVTVSNATPEPASGSVVAVVAVRGAKSILAAPVALGPGESAVVGLEASGPIGGVDSVGIIMDDPNPM